jgi:Phage tail tube protein
VTYLARLTKLGMAPETSQYTYRAPTVSVPWNGGTKYVDMITPLRDESYRANDAVLQGIVQGPAWAEWTIDVNGYADVAGHWLKAIIGPDTVTGGVATTLASNSLINASSLSLTASVPSNSVIQVSDTGGANLEYVKVGTVTGAGPYTAPITAGGGTGGNTTKYAHTAAGGSVISPYTHTFKQNRTFSTVWPTYSFTTDDGADQLGWAGCMCSELGVKIDPKGFITFAPKFIGLPSAAQSTFSYAASAVPPNVGWGWTVTNAGGSSTRGLTMDLTLKRATEGIWGSGGIQAPREIFPGALEADGTYKAIFENDTDLNLFKAYNQTVTTHLLTQAPLLGGQSLQLTMSQSGYTTGEKDLGQQYTQLTQALSGIANSTDGGVIQAVLTNYQSSAY